MKLKRYKKWTVVMLTITLVMMVFCTTINSYATDVTVDNTFGDLIYGYTANDMLSNNNYLNYYDTVDGYLKYCGQSTPYYLNNNDVDFGSTLESTVLSHLDDTSANSIRNTVFADVEGIKFTRFSWWRSDYSTHLMNCTVKGDGEFTCVNGVWISDQPFDIYIVTYTCQNHGANGYVITDNDVSPTKALQSNYILHAELDNQLNKYVYDYSGYMFYCEIPYYMIAYKNSSYSDGDYLVDTYGYDNWRNVYNAIGTDTTGFVIDRRTEHMIDETSGGGSGGTLGTLSGSFHHLYGGTSLQDSKLLTMYQLNEYADNNRYNVYLNYNYKFDLSGVYNTIPLDFHADYYSINGNYDSYLIGSSNYLAIDMNKAFEKMTITNLSDEDGVIDALAQIRSTYNGKRPYYVAVNPVDCFDVLSQAGFSTYSTYDVSRTELLTTDYGNDLLNFSSSLVDDLRSWIFGKPYETQTSISSGVANNTTLCKLTITTFLSYGNETSSTAIYTYDFLNGSWSSEGSMDYDGDQSFDGYDYKNPNNDVNDYNNAIVPSDYYSSGGYIQTTGGNGYGGNASIGNITIGAGETIVDMTTDEWLTHSPNYNDLITTLKNGITAVSEDSGSVTALLTETYTVFPVPIWGYLTLAIATISALAVIRYIRRG